MLVTHVHSVDFPDWAIRGPLGCMTCVDNTQQSQHKLCNNTLTGIHFTFSKKTKKRKKFGRSDHRMRGQRGHLTGSDEVAGANLQTEITI